MEVLFIGGTGIISSACSELALRRGFHLTLLNRGETSYRPVPKGARVIYGDIRDPQEVAVALADLTFDVVVDWIAFTPEHVQTDLDLFRDRTSQYIFISSASAYQKPPVSLPIRESTPLRNPYWQYSQDKIACEELLQKTYRESGFPITIVRPSHTYDQTMVPIHGGYTMIARMREGKPVIVPGDGTSLWVLTHHRDFAKGFVGLLGNPHAAGEDFQITSDELLTWNQIYMLIARAAGAQADLVHVPSDLIEAYDPGWGAGLLGDKANSVIFDNLKIKRLVPDYSATIPFSKGVDEIIAWYDQDPARQVIDKELDRKIDKILSAYQLAWPAA